MVATDWPMVSHVENLIGEMERKAGHHALEPVEIEQLAALRRQRLRLVRLPAPFDLMPLAEAALFGGARVQAFYRSDK